MLDLAHELKAKKKKGILGEELKGKNIVLVFDKSSTRTRCSFEVAAMDEGAHVTYLTNSHMNKRNLLKILLRFSEECMMRSSIVDLDRIS